MKFLPWGWGSSAMPCIFTHNLFQAFPDKKYVKKYQYSEGDQPPKFQRSGFGSG